MTIIEDVAQATGSQYFEKKCGTVGRFGAFSFYPSKNLGALGDGGAVFVKSSEDFERLQMLRNYGQSSRYRADMARGENSRLDEIQAAVLHEKLKHLERWNFQRHLLDTYYKNSLLERGLPVQVQAVVTGTSVVKHLFVVKVNPRIRDALQDKLQVMGIQTLVHYPVPLYRQPAFGAYERIPNLRASELCDSVLSLPFHQHLTEKDIDFISDCLAFALETIDI